MSISKLRLRAEIGQLKNSIIAHYEPVCKVFILGTANSPTQAEIDAYTQAHPHTHVLILTRKSFKKAFYDS